MVIYNQEKEIRLPKTKKEDAILFNDDFLKQLYNDTEKEGYSKDWKDATECASRIESIIRRKPILTGGGYWKSNYDIPVIAYILFKVATYNDPFGFTFKQAIEELDYDIAELAKTIDAEDVWKELLELVKEYSLEVFAIVACSQKNEDPMKTPDGLVKLAKKILNVKKDDVFVDYCCGSGTVAKSVREDSPEAKVSGYDNDIHSLAMAKVFNDITKANISFECKDVFSINDSNNSNDKPTKVFSNYPFGVRLKDQIAGKEYLDEFIDKIPSISKATSSDWLFNTFIVENMSEDGKAVAIMTNGGTWNTIDAPIRQYFIENGLIESVIALPSRLFQYTNISTSLVVFSHDNDGIRLIDATDCYVAGRRINELSDEKIDEILVALEEDKDNSVYLDTNTLRENDYVLNLSRYMSKSEEIENGITFGSVIKRITRGASINASELDNCTSTIPTDKQYLMLANIQNGLIDKNLTYLKEIDKKNLKYCLTDKCFLLSKNGFPYKCAVVEIKDNQKILASGNLYIIELDEEKINPYYLAAYFGSEKGIAALKNISVGVAVSNIGVELLKNLVIPIPDMEEQNKIAEKYLACRSEIALLQLKLERAKNKMAHIIEERSEA